VSRRFDMSTGGSSISSERRVDERDAFCSAEALPVRGDGCRTAGDLEGVVLTAASRSNARLLVSSGVAGETPWSWARKEREPGPWSGVAGICEAAGKKDGSIDGSW
jgi:hypothetical protein